MKNKGLWLKIAIFATGISGLVSEFILSTLASYFIGDTIIQWTIVLSLMLFAMGLGSHASRLVKKNLLTTFLLIEFSLSLLISFAPLLVYSLAAKTEFIHILIYGLSLLVGFCIGFEIPLATRLNETYEPLDKNISNILSWDYIGSLVGGLLFAFWGLPYLGITNTAFVFGFLNFGVALLLLYNFRALIFKEKKWLIGIACFLMVIISFGFVLSEKIILYSEQSLYKDKIVYQEQSNYQKITVTQWQEHYWLYINGNQQLSTFDEFLYHEPMVHPVMALTPEHKDILIIGGGDGFNVKELLKYEDIHKITVVDLDPAMTKLGKDFEGLVKYNEKSLHDAKVDIINDDGFTFLEKRNHYYDLIIIDLPDAKNIELNKLYSLEFYQMAYQSLRPNGHLITQAGSPYYATKAFYCIDKTMKAAGFNNLQLHNQVLTLGEWGWIIGSKKLTKQKMINIMENASYKNLNTKWFTNETIKLMTSFGKPMIDTTGVEINTINTPVLYRYYLDGNWDLY
ncbi:polyamine aminopropyltransferase [Kordia sp. YSTF-M3]|uniref:Polyamine aminopropyltransferase n=1 Tax=Kordia aestuariivivens TaxID=2759037 RepID=A0ABR7Q665_9FLAO|nr:polyamine aminopropyltransferase [Kordia aestuariivivens]MBC8754066.1 polyamine aminopropyltransferase [Kordia aestuariivivens]